jgi:hypothetical protein
MTIRSPKDWKEQLGQAKKTQRERAREEADAAFGEPIPIQGLFVHGPQANDDESGDTNPAYQEEESVMTPSVPVVVQPAPPIVAQASGQNVMVSSTIPIADPVNQQFRPRAPMDDRRSQAPKVDNSGCIPVPPVPLNHEQQEMVAMIYIAEQYYAAMERRRERRLMFFNQWATLIISVLGIVGGGLAIRNGLNAATERDVRR